MKIILLNHVIKNNVIDGKLQPGNYNVAYDGVMSCAPMYRMFDGEKWEGEGEGERTMTVFVREGDYTSDVKGICYEMFGEYIRDHFEEVYSKKSMFCSEFVKTLYVKLEDNILKFTDKRNINFVLDNNKLGFPLLPYIRDGLYRVEYYENMGSYTNPENRLYLKPLKSKHAQNFYYRLTISNKIEETVVHPDKDVYHEYQFPISIKSDQYTHRQSYYDNNDFILDTYNLKHEKLNTQQVINHSIQFRYDTFDG